MMCAPFCKLGGVGPSSLDSTPGAPGTMSSVMGTVSALFTLNTMGTCCDAASSIGIWTLTWPLLKKYSGALNAPICAKVLLKSVGQREDAGAASRGRQAGAEDFGNDAGRERSTDHGIQIVQCAAGRQTGRRRLIFRDAAKKLRSWPVARNWRWR